MPGSFAVPKATASNFSPIEFSRKPRPPKFPREAIYPIKWLSTRYQTLVDLLELIRAEFGGKPVKIGSAYRDEAYNTSIGSKPTSQHVQGRAADITIAGVSPAKVHDGILKMYEEGRLPMLGGLGSYPTFTHVDVRPTKKLARWTGSRKEN